MAEKNVLHKLTGQIASRNRGEDRSEDAGLLRNFHGKGEVLTTYRVEWSRFDGQMQSDMTELPRKYHIHVNVLGSSESEQDAPTTPGGFHKAHGRLGAGVGGVCMGVGGQAGNDVIEC